MSAISSSSATSRIKHLQDLSTAIQENTCRARHYLVLTREDRARVLSKLGVSVFDWELIKHKMQDKELKRHVYTEVNSIVQEIPADAEEPSEISTTSKITDYWQKEMDTATPKKELSDLIAVQKEESERAAQAIKDRDLIGFFQYLSCYAPPPILHNLAQTTDITSKAALIREWMLSNPNALQRISQITVTRSELKTFPPEIGLLTNLKTLMLAHGQIEILPDEIGNLSNLEMLSLPHHKIKTISPKIRHLTKLKTLALGYNQLETLPKELVHLSSLQRLGLKGNPLKFLPPEIRQLKKFPKITI